MFTGGTIWLLTHVFVALHEVPQLGANFYLFFGGEGSPTKVDYRNKGTLILTSAHTSTLSRVKPNQSGSKLDHEQVHWLFGGSRENPRRSFDQVPFRAPIFDPQPCLQSRSHGPLGKQPNLKSFGVRQGASKNPEACASMAYNL